MNEISLKISGKIREFDSPGFIMGDLSIGQAVLSMYTQLSTCMLSYQNLILEGRQYRIDYTFL